MTPLDGYLINIVNGRKTPLRTNVVKEKEFDEMDQRYKDFFVEILDESSQRVALAACPFECKFTSIFLWNFLFF